MTEMGRVFLLVLCTEFLAFAAHVICLEEDADVDFFDNNGTPIYETDLYAIIEQKLFCGCFFVELKISGECNKSITTEVSDFFFAFSSDFHCITCMNLILATANLSGEKKL